MHHFVNGDRYRSDINVDAPVCAIALRYFVVKVFALYSGSSEPKVSGVVAAGSRSKNNVCLELCKIKTTPYPDLNILDLASHPPAEHLGSTHL